MDTIANYLGYTGYAVAVISAIFAYINRDRYKTLIRDIYEPGNKELREQINSERTKVADLNSENSTIKAQLTEKENRIKDLKELNARLPDYAALSEKSNQVITVISNNHKEVMKQITNLAKEITTKVEPK